MSNKDNSNAIGNPEPIEPNDSLFDPIPCIVAFVGGIVALAFLAAPTRLAGATQSAKLKWQQRQLEIEQAIAADASGANRPTIAIESSSAPK